MSDNLIFGVVLTAMLSYLAFVYKNIYRSRLKNKYLSLYVKKSNRFALDSVEQCLEARRNGQLLTSYFYRVNVVDYCVKKIVPMCLFVCFFVFIFSGIKGDGLLDFKISPVDGESSASYVVGKEKISLKSGELLYRYEDQIYIVDSSSAALISVKESDVFSVGGVVLMLSVVILLIFLLAAAYFFNLSSSEDFSRSLKADILHLEEELNLVVCEIDQSQTKTETEYKQERLAALENKKLYIHSLIESLKRSQISYEQ